MPVGKILASVTGGVRDAAILGYAVEAARPFNAHVVAFFVRPDLSQAIAYFNDGVSGPVVDEVIKASREAADEAANRIKATLAAVCDRASATLVPSPRRANAVTLSFHEEQGNFADQLTDAARLSDLVVFGPLREGDTVGLAEAFVQVLVETDRPVLLATDATPSSFARRVAIGWDGKNAASQAVSAAIPYLVKAEHVEILSVQRTAKAPASDALKDYLALHGVTCSERAIARKDKSTGEVLLDAARDVAADLLIVGGYGHSRFRESLIGGVTRHVLTHAKMPVFMVH